MLGIGNASDILNLISTSKRIDMRMSMIDSNIILLVILEITLESILVQSL